MTEETHYQVLGVEENANFDEIRKSYRRLVLRFHPDRSGDKRTTDKFVRINQAYEVLADPERRSNYDLILRLKRETDRASKRTASREPRTTFDSRAARERASDQKAQPDLAARIAHAAGLLAQGKFDRAENICNTILRSHPRSAMAHAILGDIARARQDAKTALKHYAFAIQFEPRNPVFHKRYEQLFREVGEIDRHGNLSATSRRWAPLWIAGFLTAMMLTYIAIANERPPTATPLFIQSWTIGLVVMLFVNGVIFGAALAVSQQVDRWETVAKSSAGRMSPAVGLGIVAVVNFWAAGLLYVFLGLLQNSFTYSISRLMTLVAVLAVTYAFMSAVSPYIMWQQTFLWGGNLLYVGALCGWAVADAFR